MNKYICLDTSVWIKYLTWEEGSEDSQRLVAEIHRRRQIVVLPDFAWAEIASVLRKKMRAGWLTAEETEILWTSFLKLEITYVHSDELMAVAWRISREENLPTVYDAAYLAVAELYSQKEETCEFWTADTQLARSLKAYKHYVRLLGEGK